jgi:hypothetical protein
MNRPTQKKGRAKLPHYRSIDDDKAMTDWVNAKLDELDAQQRSFIAVAEENKRQNWDDADDLDTYIDAVKRARSGDIEPLRRMYPHLAEFLQRPTRRRGEHLKDRVIGPAKRAAIDVKIIRMLWKGLSPKGVTSEQIAADRHKVC